LLVVSEDQQELKPSLSFPFLAAIAPTVAISYQPSAISFQQKHQLEASAGSSRISFCTF
jgi:hypothetical protein